MTRQAAVVGVVGLGGVGEPLLRALAAAGFRGVGVEPDPRVLGRVERRLGARSGPAAEVVLGTDPALLADADLVIEAGSGSFETVAAALRGAAEVCGDATVLATTSRHSLPRVGIASGRPRSTLGLGLLTPPAQGTAFEVVQTAATEQRCAELLGTVLTEAGLEHTALGRPAARNASRLVLASLNRAAVLLSEGEIGRDAIDTAMRLGCGLPLGPLRMLDHLGIDTVHADLCALRDQTGDAATFEPAPLLTALLRDGRLGEKTGEGFYRYTDAGTPVPEDDPHQDADAAADCGVRTVGVLGSGLMARGIAELVALRGMRAVLVARSAAKADSALEAVSASLTRAVRRGLVSAEERKRALGLLDFGAEHTALADCDLVVEAVVEDQDVKREMFALLGAVCKPSAILATTTSSLSVAACATASGRPEQVVGMHFFNPAPVMRLVELSATGATSPQTAATARRVCAALGKHPVATPDRVGFIVNYLLFPYLADAVRLLADPDTDIAATDRGVRSGYGYPMGPFALLDTIGLDVSLAILRTLYKEYSLPELAPPDALVQLTEQCGAVGRKGGWGFRSW